VTIVTIYINGFPVSRTARLKSVDVRNSGNQPLENFFNGPVVMGPGQLTLSESEQGILRRRNVTPTGFGDIWEVPDFCSFIDDIPSRY
jgi:hypothetical protein